MKLLAHIFLCLAIGSVSIALADEVVLSVQRELKQLGYYDGVVDGQMGSQTAAAIRRYQMAEKLKVTGEMNAQTLRQSWNLSPARPRPRKDGPCRSEVSGSPYVALADMFKGGPFISVGPEMQIAVIRQAQRNLRLLGYYKGPIDGIAKPLACGISQGVAGRRRVSAKRADSMKTRSRDFP